MESHSQSSRLGMAELQVTKEQIRNLKRHLSDSRTDVKCPNVHMQSYLRVATASSIVYTKGSGQMLTRLFCCVRYLYRYALHLGPSEITFLGSSALRIINIVTSSIHGVNLIADGTKFREKLDLFISHLIHRPASVLV